MTPLEFLALMLTVTAAAYGAQLFRRRRHLARLRQLAADNQMHFSAVDRFRLAPRVAQRIPIPGAAAVRDVWARADLGSFSGSFGAPLRPHASRLLRVMPAAPVQQTLSPAATRQGARAWAGSA